MESAHVPSFAPILEGIVVINSVLKPDQILQQLLQSVVDLLGDHVITVPMGREQRQLVKLTGAGVLSYSLNLRLCNPFGRGGEGSC